MIEGESLKRPLYPLCYNALALPIPMLLFFNKPRAFETYGLNHTNTHKKWKNGTFLIKWVLKGLYR